MFVQIWSGWEIKNRNESLTSVSRTFHTSQQRLISIHRSCHFLFRRHVSEPTCPGGYWGLMRLHFSGWILVPLRHFVATPECQKQICWKRLQLWFWLHNQNLKVVFVLWPGSLLSCNVWLLCQMRIVCQIEGYRHWSFKPKQAQTSILKQILAFGANWFW